MDLLKTSTACLVRFDRGERIPDSLIELAVSKEWETAALIGIGAVEDAELAYYDLEKKSYLTFPVEGIVELLSLQGNLSRLNGQPCWHLHAIVGDRHGSTRGGHLINMKVAITLECWVWSSSLTAVRLPDQFTGLNLLHFE